MEQINVNVNTTTTTTRKANKRKANVPPVVPTEETKVIDLGITRIRKDAEAVYIGTETTRSYLNDCLSAGIPLDKVCSSLQAHLVKAGWWYADKAGTRTYEGSKVLGKSYATATAKHFKDTEPEMVKIIGFFNSLSTMVSRENKDKETYDKLFGVVAASVSDQKQEKVEKPEKFKYSIETIEVIQSIVVACYDKKTSKKDIANLLLSHFGE